MTLLKLPYEMFQRVTDFLDLDDVWQLSLTCRNLRSRVTNPSLAKRLLEVLLATMAFSLGIFWTELTPMPTTQKKAPAATETQTALAKKKYVQQLLRLLKRRQSISSVTPYLAAVVGFADDWIYRDGVLCYIRQGQLRILNLHRSATDEIVVNIRLLLAEAMPRFQRRIYRFRPLNVSNNIVSCLVYYMVKCPCHGNDDPAGYLVIFNAQDRKILTAPFLQGFDPKSVIVRNNDKVLYVIRRTRSHGPPRTSWNAYDIGTSKWRGVDTDTKLCCILSLRYKRQRGVHPVDIDTTNCFEIFDGSIYSLSNHSELEQDEGHWTAGYACQRIDSPFDIVATIRPDRLLRRDHQDGPMDHRWTFMKMFKDEATGEIKVVESRTEWIKNSSYTVRTYYTTTVEMSRARLSSWEPDDDGESFDGNNLGGNNSSENSQSGTGKPEPTPRNIPPRDPQNVHPGDDSSKRPMLLRNKCPILSYHPSCQTFLDLVDLSPSNSDKRRMRLRGGTRHRRRLEEIEDWSRTIQEKGSLSVVEKHFEEVHKAYKNEEPVLWPPEQDKESPNPALARLHEMLSPPKSAGEITGDWDERSFLYATGPPGGGRTKALVFVSFDPSILLAGTLPYPGPMVFGRPQSVDTKAPTTTDDSSTAHNSHGNEASKGRQTVSTGHTSTARNASAEATQVRNTKTDAAWCTIETAQYQTIKRGFHFASERYVDKARTGQEDRAVMH